MILLFGMPRSGTTWVGKIFDSHPATRYYHEPDSRAGSQSIALFVEGDLEKEACEDAASYVRTLLASRELSVFSKRPIFDKAYYSWLKNNLNRFNISLSGVMARIGLGKASEAWLGGLSTQGLDVIPVWKSIESLGRLPLFIRCFADYKGVHIVRHPAGYIASVLKGESGHSFQSSTPTSEDYGMFQVLLNTEHGVKLGISLSDLKKMDEIQRLTIRWRLYNEIAHDECADKANYYLLKYERLCNQPIELSKSLFDFCGLSWNRQSEQFVSMSVSKTKQSYYSVFKNPLVSANKWKETLGDKEMNKIRDLIAGSTLEFLYKEDL